MSRPIHSIQSIEKADRQSAGFFSFLSDLTLWFSLPTGNCWRRVSYPTCHHGIPYRQETVCEGFPILLDAMVLPYRQETIREGFLSQLVTIVFLSPQETFTHQCSMVG